MKRGNRAKLSEIGFSSQVRSYRAKLSGIGFRLKMTELGSVEGNR